jgi:hemolysin activation/secretion protein
LAQSIRRHGNRLHAAFAAIVPAVLFAPGLLQAAEAGPAETETPAKVETFDVLEFRVLGNSMLAAADIEAALYEYLGPDKDLSTIEAARQALEAAFRLKGYGTVFVDIPEQAVGADGVVRLHVTEGRLDRIRVSGARYFSNGHIRASLPSLSAGTVLHLPTLQDELASLNRESRDREVAPVLRAGKQPGKVDIDLKVEDKLPLHFSTEVNNQYTADTTPTRFSATVSYDNMWQKFHSLSLQYQTAPEKVSEARVLAATYIAPLGAPGNLLATYAVDTNSDVAAVGTLSVLGAGRIYGTRYIALLPDASDYSHNISFGADYKDFVEAIRLVGGDTDQTPIRYMTWNLGYSGNKFRETSATHFNIGANFGLRGLVNRTAQFEVKRFKARSSFFSFRGDLRQEMQLPRGMQGVIRFAAQAAAQPLISNEQFAVGGAESVRGYLAAEALGDIGTSATLELLSPPLGGFLGVPASSLRLSAFYDAAYVRIFDPILNDTDPSLSQDRSTRLSAAGLGLRFADSHGVEAVLDWAYPLTATDRTDRGTSRFHFRIRASF